MRWAIIILPALVLWHEVVKDIGMTVPIISFPGHRSSCHSRTVEVGRMVNRLSCVMYNVVAIVTGESLLDFGWSIPCSLHFTSYPEHDLRVSS